METSPGALHSESAIYGGDPEDLAQSSGSWVPFRVERAIRTSAIEDLAWHFVGQMPSDEAIAPEDLVNQLTRRPGVYRVRRADQLRGRATYVRVDRDGLARRAIT